MGLFETEVISLEISELFLLAFGLLLVILGFLIGKVITDRKWEGLVQGIRDEAVKKSRAVLAGQFSEQIAPYLPDFKHSPTEVRFIGKPVDFIVFEGMDGKDIRKVVFVEVKTGKSGLSTHERKLRDVIKEGKVEWEEYRVESGGNETSRGGGAPS